MDWIRLGFLHPQTINQRSTIALANSSECPMEKSIGAAAGWGLLIFA
jgi:hypothetical protein